MAKLTYAPQLGFLSTKGCKGVELYDEFTVTFTNKRTNKSVAVDVVLYMDWDKKCWRYQIKNLAGVKLKSGTAVCTFDELLGRIGKRLKFVYDSSKHYLSHGRLPKKPKVSPCPTRGSFKGSCFTPQL
jgi:hypothetical protein